MRALTSPQTFKGARSTERLESLIGGGGSLSSQAAKMRDGGNVAHRRIAAQLAVGAKDLEVGETAEMRDTTRRHGRNVPEQIQLHETIEAGQAGETGVGNRTIDQQMRARACWFGVDLGRSAPGMFQEREIVQDRNPLVGDQPSTAEIAQMRLALERFDGTVPGWRSHEVHALEPLAEPQVADSRVRDATLPGHLESAQLRQ